MEVFCQWKSLIKWLWNVTTWCLNRKLINSITYLTLILTITTLTPKNIMKIFTQLDIFEQHTLVCNINMGWEISQNIVCVGGRSVVKINGTGEKFWKVKKVKYNSETLFPLSMFVTKQNKKYIYILYKSRIKIAHTNTGHMIKVYKSIKDINKCFHWQQSSVRQKFWLWWLLPICQNPPDYPGPSYILYTTMESGPHKLEKHGVCYLKTIIWND